MKCRAQGLVSRSPPDKSSQTPKQVEAWMAQVKGLPQPRYPLPTLFSRLPTATAHSPVPRPPERPRARPQRLGNGRRPRLQRRQPGPSSVRPQRQHSRHAPGTRWIRGPELQGAEGRRFEQDAGVRVRGTRSSLPF